VIAGEKRRLKKRIAKKRAAKKSPDRASLREFGFAPKARYPVFSFLAIRFLAASHK
jgi:hypothetical protein